MPPGKFKYDVAISFAQEDFSVAEKIAAALRAAGITYYLYAENIALHWGENLFRISYDTYTSQSRYVLLLISKFYIRKKWPGIERQIVQSVNSKLLGHILPLRIDDTRIDGLSNNTVFVKWQNNPRHIAALIKERLVRDRKTRKYRYAYSIPIALLFIIIISGGIYFKLLNKTGSGPIGKHDSTKPEGKHTEPIDSPVNGPKRGRGDPVTNTESKKDSPTIKAPEDPILYQYCITVSGNNEKLNQLVSSSAGHLLNGRNLTVGTACRNAEKTISISLEELTTRSDIAPDIVSSSCNYTIDIIPNRGGEKRSDAGRIGTPGFSLETNMSNLSKEIKEKLNQLL